MPRARSSIFGQQLGQAIERGAMSISQAIQARYLEEAKKAQDKANKAWASAQYLMQQGLEPAAAQYVTNPRAQPWMQDYMGAYEQGMRKLPEGGIGIEGQPIYPGRVPPGYRPDLIGQFAEWRKGRKQMMDLGMRENESLIESRKAPKTFFMYDPATGKQIGVVEAPKGAQPLAIGEKKEKTPIVSAEKAKLIGNAQSGLKNLGKLRDIYTGPRGKTILTKIGGVGADIASIKDTEAQNAIIYANEIADVISRLRTGAAINANEERIYNEKLRSRFRTMDAQMTALNQVDNFLSAVINEIQAGKRQYNPPTETKPGPWRSQRPSAEERFSQLEDMGIKEDDIYTQMAKEGY